MVELPIGCIYNTRAKRSHTPLTPCTTTTCWVVEDTHGCAGV